VKFDFVANLPVSLPVKEFWKSVNIWVSYGQEFGVLFFWDTVYIDDLIVKLTKANLGCCIGIVSFCCLFYADDIVLLSGSLYKLYS